MLGFVFVGWLIGLTWYYAGVLDRAEDDQGSS